MAYPRPILALMLGVLTTFAAARADWKDLIPADAQGIIVVRDVKSLEANIKGYAETIGYPLPPLLAIEPIVQSVGLGGWKMDEGAAFVTLDLEAGPQGGVFLMPVQDEKRTLQELDAKPSGEYFIAKIGAGGKPMTILPRSGLLIAAQSEAPIQKFLGAGGSLVAALSDDQRQKLNTSSIVLMMNTVAVRPKLQQIMEQQWKAGEAEFRQKNAANLESQLAGFNWSTEIFRGVVEDSTAIFYGISVSKDRIELQTEVWLATGSKYGGFTTAFSPSSQLFEGMPGMPFFLAGSVNLSAIRATFLDFFRIFDGLKLQPTDEERKVLNQLKSAAANAEVASLLMDMTDNGVVIVGRLTSKEPAVLVDLADQGVQTLRASLAAQQKPEFFSAPVEKSLRGTAIRSADVLVNNQPAADKDVALAVLGKTPRLQWGVVDGSLLVAFASKPDPIELFQSTSASVLETQGVKSGLGSNGEPAIGALLLDEAGYARITTMIKNVGQTAEQAFAGVAKALNPNGANEVPPRTRKPMPPATPPTLPSVSIVYAVEKNSFALRFGVPAATVRSIIEQSKKVGAIPQ